MSTRIGLPGWYASPLTWSLLWLVLVVTSLLTRSYLPVDETRYVTVAWEMWLRGDFLVPHLNGQPYSDKAPLLFWFMHAGWWLFGINEITPRLVSPLFSLLDLFLIHALARRLWPARAQIAAAAPWLLFGGVFFATMITMTMFDSLVTFTVLLAMLGMLQTWQSGRWHAWLLVGLALGLGLIAKGPVVLLHVLPAALLAPWWMTEHRPRWLHWYAGMLGGVLLAALIGLSWAWPAAQAGGEAYANAILWGQSADRISGGDAPHSAPIWWYLPILPAMLLPWTAWPELWRGMTGLRRQPAEAAVRFCLAWAVPVFIAFSLISGKRPHYLLPMLPALALLGARALAQLDAAKPVGNRSPALLLILFGLLYMTLVWRATQLDNASWLEHPQLFAGLVPVATGLLLFRVPIRTQAGAVVLWALISTGAVLFIYTQIIAHMATAYDVRPAARFLGTAQQQGIPIANLRKYHGQYQFLGRLTRPLEVIQPADMQHWASRNPQGLLIITYDEWRGHPPKARYAQPYRGGGLIIWDGATLLSQPGWAQHWP